MLLNGWRIAGRRYSRMLRRMRARQVRGRAAPPGRTRLSQPGLFSLVGYRRWWLLHAPIAVHRSDARGLVVIGGAARSGTTLLQNLLGRHPSIATCPETTIFLRRISSPEDLGWRMRWGAETIKQWQRESRSQVEFIDRFRRALLAETGKPIWVEKTPGNVRRFEFIRRCFPNARIIHIIRDGRDAICSLRPLPFAKLGETPRHSPEAVTHCGLLWNADVKAGLRLRGDPAYCEVRYEELVGSPEETLRRLIEFVGLPWRTEVLVRQAVSDLDRFGDALWSEDIRQVFAADGIAASGEIFADSVGRWRRELSCDEIAALQPLIAPLLIELGYARGAAWE
jgi:protein-tyrosine sulfotransferase